DPLQPKFARDYFAGTAEILAHLIVDDGDPEGRIHTFSPSFSSTYFLLIIADSFGVRALSGMASSSTIPHPRKLILRSAASTAGRFTEPRPSSTKRYDSLPPAASGRSSTSFRCRKSSRSLYFSTAFAGSPPP